MSPQGPNEPAAATLRSAAALNRAQAVLSNVAENDSYGYYYSDAEAYDDPLLPPPADAAPEQHEHLRRQCGDGACAPPRRLLRKVGDAKFAPGAEQGAVVALLDTHPSMPFAVACFSDGSAGILRV